MSPIPCTSTGTRTRFVVAEPMPSFPPMFDPHVQTVPSDFKMMVPLAPPQMEMTSAAGAIETSAKASDPTATYTLIGKRISFSDFQQCPGTISRAVAGFNGAALEQPTGHSKDLMSTIRSAIQE